MSKSYNTMVRWVIGAALGSILAWVAIKLVTGENADGAAIVSWLTISVLAVGMYVVRQASHY
jgi:hypothetical protein